jgi:hypothetical protein
MKPPDLAIEMRRAVANLTDDDRHYLVRLGIPTPVINIFELVGIERVQTSREFYEPATVGHAVYLTPVLAHYAGGPETPSPELFACRGNLIDIVAWDHRAPEQWALRAGAAAWLGCISPQCCEPDPVRIWRSPLDWLRNGLSGLVILARERAEVYRLLSGCRGGIIADDWQHARELREILARPWPAPTVRAADYDEVPRAT